MKNLSERDEIFFPVDWGRDNFGISRMGLLKVAKVYDIK